MTNVKPTATLAYTSLVDSCMACVGAGVVAYICFSPPRETTGVSAGLALLVYSSLTLLFCLIGLITGIRSLMNIRTGRSTGQKLAIAGIVLGVLSVLMLSSCWYVQLMM